MTGGEDIAGPLSRAEVLATGQAIARMQEPSGAIAWPDGHVDVWDHVECAMALAAGGRYDAAARAYGWLLQTQRTDGTWVAKYVQGRPAESYVDTNHCAYVAVGVWHFWLLTQSTRFAVRMWPCVRRAIDFVVAMQTPTGAIRWCTPSHGQPGESGLLAASSSIHQSLRCALALANLLGEPRPDWELAAAGLRDAILLRPDAFEPKDEYAMDWYYPVLAGPVRSAAASARLSERWDEFVVPDLGSRCRSDGMWVTGAETCELVLALDAAGLPEAAMEQFAAMQHLRDASGAYWTGVLADTRVRWPAYASSWTAATVVLAADALSQATPGSGIFRGYALPVVSRDLPDSAPALR
jgi:hypothetical protein